MKNYSKIALLVVLVLFLSLTACTLKASKAPTAAQTPTGEAPFPVFTPGDVTSFGTQTAIALTPASTAPQVVVSTETPSSGIPIEGEQPSATPQPQAQAQAPAAPEAVNTPVVNRPTTYTLQKGEWPICIARRYNLDISSFFSTNGLNMNSKPAVGTTLKIPASGSWSANYGARSLKAHPTSYTVVAGDSVHTIACRYGDVTTEAILAVNGLANAGDIKSGMSLKIP
jgi:LysM repeat protein